MRSSSSSLKSPREGARIERRSYSNHNTFYNTRGFLIAFLTNDRKNTEEMNGRRVWLPEKDIDDGWSIRRTSEWVQDMTTAVDEAGL